MFSKITHCRIDGEHKTTADAKDFLRKKWYYNECIRQYELPEWRDLETIPKTDACYYAVHDLYTLQHYKWDITAANLEEWMVTMYRKTGVLIKSLPLLGLQARIPQTPAHPPAA